MIDAQGMGNVVPTKQAPLVRLTRKSRSHREPGAARRVPRKHLLIGIALALPAFPSLATTLSELEVDDPIAPGQTCRVLEPASYGGYIYYSPSRFDFVFWPLTEAAGVWHCDRSGFTALIGDFEGLSESEVTAIRAHLATNYDGKQDPVTRLTLLEDIYRLRKKDAFFENRLLRVFARRYQDMGLLERANGYRLLAFEQLRTLLKTDLPELARLEYLYLAANYARQFGDTAASDRYLVELEAAIQGISDPELAEHLEYMSELAKQSRLIKSGGQLDPVLE